MDGLTELQLKFVEEYVRDGCRNARQAALLAGYSKETADNAHRDILGSIPVKAAVDEAADVIRRTFMHRLTVEAGPRAVATLLAVLNDNTASPSARLAAARDVLDRIGVGRIDTSTKTQQPTAIRVVFEPEDEAL